MSGQPSLESICDNIAENYSSCDAADALLKLKCPLAGFLPDIAPIPRERWPKGRMVAPISTVYFIPKGDAGPPPSDDHVPTTSNIPKGTHWTDCPPPGTVVLLQQPEGQSCALLGDLLATRLKVRGVKGAVVDGRVRDVDSIGQLCAGGAPFQVWSRAVSAVGTGLEAKPWAVDVPLKIGPVTVRPGDIMVADEADRSVVVIPRAKLDEVLEMLPGLKEADDKVLQDVLAGVDLNEAFARHRGR